MKKTTSLISILLVICITLSSCAGKGFRAVAVADGIDMSNFANTVGVPEELRPYYSKTTEYMLANDSDNVVFSPVGAYTVLAMLAECVKGESRQQILSAFSDISLNDSRDLATSLIYTTSDGAHMAQSIWLPDNYRYNKDVLRHLTDSYDTSVYEGAYGSPEMLDAVKAWMKDNTLDSLDAMIEGFEFSANSEMLILNALSFNDEWREPFDPQKTKTAPFYAKDGEVSAEFMNAECELEYKETENFTCVSVPLKKGGRMTFMLPAEEKMLSEVLSDEYARQALRYMPFCEDEGECTLSIPKFDITQNNDLIGMAKALGVDKIFDDPDFSAFSDDLEDTFVKNFSQMINVSIDEEGVEASSVTILEGSYKGEPDFVKSFVFNRPFAFSIFNASGTPIFMGTVNNPS